MNYCMSTGLQLPRKILKPEVRIIQGNLDDQMLREMPEVEVLIVNGDVHLTTNHPMILPELVVLGNLKAKHLHMHRGLMVTGVCIAQYVRCSDGNLMVGPGSKIEDFSVFGSVNIGNPYYSSGD